VRLDLQFGVSRAWKTNGRHVDSKGQALRDGERLKVRLYSRNLPFIARLFPTAQRDSRLRETHLVR
jgi:hypothetical protein